MHVYNEVRFIERTLESVIGEADEIILADNASTDGTSDICRTYASKYPEIKYFRQKENIGSGANNQFCIDRASGEYIRNIGGHDMISHGSTRNMLKLIEQNPDVVMVYPKYAVYLNTDYSIQSFQKSFNSVEEYCTGLASESAFVRMESFLKYYSEDSLCFYLARRDIVLECQKYYTNKNTPSEITFFSFFAIRGKIVADKKSLVFFMRNRNDADLKATHEREVKMAFGETKKYNMYTRIFNHICGSYEIAKKMQAMSNAPKNFAKEMLDIVLTRAYPIEGIKFTLDNMPDILPEKKALVEEVCGAIVSYQEFVLSRRYKIGLMVRKYIFYIRKCIKYILPYGVVRIIQKCRPANQ
jgi:glycosyltransferase involved in cell wall biosynthesis